MNFYPNSESSTPNVIACMLLTVIGSEQVWLWYSEMVSEQSEPTVDSHR